MNEEIFEMVCAPLLGVEGTRMLAISTPDGSGNYYSLLFQKRRPDGTRLCKTVEIGLSCDDCRLSGRQADCTHVLWLLPSWKSFAGHELQRALVRESVFRQEAGGEIINSQRFAFLRSDIAALFAKPRVTICGPDRGMVFIAVDPSGGGSGKSECAMIAGVLDQRRNFIVCTIITHAHSHCRIASHCNHKVLESGVLGLASRAV